MNSRGINNCKLCMYHNMEQHLCLEDETTKEQCCRGSLIAFLAWLLPAVHPATWLTSVTCGLLSSSHPLFGEGLRVQGMGSTLHELSFLSFAFNALTRLHLDRESSSQRNTLYAWRIKGFLALYGISYWSLRHKRTEESLSLAQMSLEETACSVQSKNLHKPSCWAAVLIMVLCGWVEMLGDSRASQTCGQCGKGHSVVGGRAAVSALHCSSSSSAWGHQGSSTTAAAPTQPRWRFRHTGPRL